MQQRYRRKFSFYILLAVVLVGLTCAVPTPLFPGSGNVEDKNNNETMTPMTLAGLGDCIIARKVSMLKDPGFLRLVELIRGVDCTWGNCEVPLVEPEKVYPEAREDFVIACEPWGADELKWLGVDFIGLANNHAVDYAVAGMFSTIENLRRVGIGYAGAGRDLEEAARPRYVDTAAGRVGQVSFTTWAPKGSNASMPHPYLKGRPGVNQLKFKETFFLDKKSFEALQKIDRDIDNYFEAEPPKEPKKELIYGDFNFTQGKAFGYDVTLNEGDLKRITEAVKIARRNARIVIISAHEHYFFNERPMAFTEKYARACIDAGGDVVFITGAHRLFGIEMYKNKPIFYSLGNFFFHFGSFGTYPPETYEMAGLPPDTLDISVVAENFSIKFPYFAHDYIYESIVPVITFANGNQVTNITLYPIYLNRDQPIYRQGTPMMAEEKRGKSIIQQLAKFSKGYGTKIVYRDGVGVIEL